MDKNRKKQLAYLLAARMSIPFDDFRSIRNVSIANFIATDDTRIMKLLVGIDPVQDLHGYDAPWSAGAMGNLLPLSGNMTKTNNGVSATLENGIITLSGTASGNAVIVFDLETAISILPENYKIAIFNSANNSSVFFRTQDGSTTLHNFAWTSVNRVVSSWTAQGEEHTTAVGVQVFDGVNVDGMSLKPMVVPLIESDPSAFYPYSNICPISGFTGLTLSHSGADTTDPTTLGISWETEAGTVYGGTLDVVSGLLTVTHANIASYDGENINEPWISSMDVYSSGGTPTTGAQVVYPLTTPQTYQLDPVNIQPLLGENNIWADTGDILILDLNY